MKKVLTGLVMALVASSAMAGTKPLNLSLIPDVAIYNRHETIHGLTLSIWGENQQSSFALGLVNGTSGDSAGLSLGILNYADNYKGCQWGVVNYTTGDCSGWQGGPFFGLLISVVNYTEGDMTGFQSGVFNYAGCLSGLQLGLVNYAKTTDDGVQIGLINIIPENQRWFSELPSAVAPVMVIVNWRF